MLRRDCSIACHGDRTRRTGDDPVGRLVVDARQRTIPTVSLIVVRVAVSLRTDADTVIAQSFLQHAQAINIALLYVGTPPIIALREVRYLVDRHVEIEHIRIERGAHETIWNKGYG